MAGEEVDWGAPLFSEGEPTSSWGGAMGTWTGEACEACGGEHEAVFCPSGCVFCGDVDHVGRFCEESLPCAVFASHAYHSRACRHSPRVARSHQPSARPKVVEGPRGPPALPPGHVHRTLLIPKRFHHDMVNDPTQLRRVYRTLKRSNGQRDEFSVDFSGRNRATDVVQVLGLPKYVQAAVAMLEELRSEALAREAAGEPYVTRELSIPHRHQPFVNGPKAHKVKARVVDVVGVVEVNFPDYGVCSDKVSVCGRRSRVEAAVGILEAMRDEAVAVGSSNRYCLACNRGGDTSALRTGSEEPVVGEMEIPVELQPMLIGAQGGVVRSVEEDIGGGVRIQFPAEGSGDVVVKIFGPARLVGDAKDRLRAKAHKAERQMAQGLAHLTSSSISDLSTEPSEAPPDPGKAVDHMRIPRAFHPWIIGTGGKVLRRIEANVGGAVQIDFPTPGTSSELVYFSGPRDAVDLAMSLVKVEALRAEDKHISIDNKPASNQGDSPSGEVVPEAPNSTGQDARAPRERFPLSRPDLGPTVRETMRVHHAYHSWIIGSGGTLMRRIDEAIGHCVAISFPPPGSTDDLIHLKGPRDAVRQAKELLQAEAARAERYRIAPARSSSSGPPKVADPTPESFTGYLSVELSGEAARSARVSAAVAEAGRRSAALVHLDKAKQRIRIGGALHDCLRLRDELFAALPELQGETQPPEVPRTSVPPQAQSASGAWDPVSSTLSLPMEGRYFKKLIGVGGRQVREWEAAFPGTWTEFLQDQDLISIRGPRRQVSELREQMRTFLMSLDRSVHFSEPWDVELC